jgi:hypothetical protein
MVSFIMEGVIIGDPPAEEPTEVELVDKYLSFKVDEGA